MTKYHLSRLIYGASTLAHYTCHSPALVIVAKSVNNWLRFPRLQTYHACLVEHDYYYWSAAERYFCSDLYRFVRRDQFYAMCDRSNKCLCYVMVDCIKRVTTAALCLTWLKLNKFTEQSFFNDAEYCTACCIAHCIGIDCALRRAAPYYSRILLNLVADDDSTSEILICAYCMHTCIFDLCLSVWRLSARGFSFQSAYRMFFSASYFLELLTYTAYRLFTLTAMCFCVLKIYALKS